MLHANSEIITVN